jgi:hypothetical protein
MDMLLLLFMMAWRSLEAELIALAAAVVEEGRREGARMAVGEGRAVAAEEAEAARMGGEGDREASRSRETESEGRAVAGRGGGARLEEDNGPMISSMSSVERKRESFLTEESAAT